MHFYFTRSVGGSSPYTDGFERYTIFDNTYRTVSHAPMYKKDVTALLVENMNAAGKGKIVLNPDEATKLLNS